MDAGWLEDPTGRFDHRYWDGSAWSEHVSTDGQQVTDPVGDIEVPPPSSPKPGLMGRAKSYGAAAKERHDERQTSKAVERSDPAEVVRRSDVPEPGVLWSGERKTMATAATAGKLVRAHYRVTNEYIYFDAGLISSSSEQVPLWAIRDVDVKQSMTQKARGVGDVVVQVEHSDYTGRKSVALESIEDPRRVRDLLNDHAHQARLEHQARQQTQFVQGVQTHIHHGGAPDPTATAPKADASTNSPGKNVVEELRQLAALRDEGILTEEEFATQKAKLLGD